MGSTYNSPASLNYSVPSTCLRVLLKDNDRIPLSLLEIPRGPLPEFQIGARPRLDIGGRDFIQTVQILADQFIHYGVNSDRDIDSDESASYPKDSFSDIVAFLFPQSSQCTVEACALIGDDPRASLASAKVIPRPTLRKQDTGKGGIDTGAAPTPSIFHLPSPSIRIRRGDIPVDISSTAMRFWEELGLSPYVGSKHLMSFCLFPNIGGMQRAVENFLNKISQTFLSLRLGSHAVGHPSMKNYGRGLAPASVPHLSGDSILSAMESNCEQLGAWPFPHVYIRET